LSRSQRGGSTIVKIPHALAKASFAVRRILRKMTVAEDPAVAPDKWSRDPF
jgi:hypothetical protein